MIGLQYAVKWVILAGIENGSWLCVKYKGTLNEILFRTSGASRNQFKEIQLNAS